MEDDTPRRFRELLQQQAASEKDGPSPPGSRGKTRGKGKGRDREATTPPVDDRWVVRPGESFREFNARIRQSGLSVPPGVSEATRHPRASPETRQPREMIPAKRLAASELSSSSLASPTLTAERGGGPGERTKQKRKEYLRQRSETKKLSKRRRTQPDSDEYESEHGSGLTAVPGGDADAGMREAGPGKSFLLGTRDVVQAPPTLNVIPRATLRLNNHCHHPQERRPYAQRNPSLLPLLRPATGAINK